MKDLWLDLGKMESDTSMKKIINLILMVCTYYKMLKKLYFKIQVWYFRPKKPFSQSGKGNWFSFVRIINLNIEIQRKNGQ